MNPGGLVAVGVALGGLAACVELARVRDVAFAPRASGLAGDQPWVSAPIGAWLLDGDVEVAAVSACPDQACQPRAAVFVFSGRGAAAERLAAVLDRPDELARDLAARAAARRPSARSRRSPASVEVEVRRSGALPGFTIRMARRDGSRPAVGYALGLKRAGDVSVVLVIAETEDAAQRIAREVAPHLG